MRDCSNINIIFTTAYRDYAVEGFDLQAVDYLLKPFDEEELLVRITNLLANYDERQAFTVSPIDKKENTLPPIISEKDQEWLIILENLVLAEMNNSIFSNDYLAQILLMERSTLYKKLKKLTGLTPAKYIKTIRLQK